MLEYQCIQDLPREKLIELVSLYAKNWLATDGLWFQSVEKKHGMDEAMEHDINMWRSFTAIEAKRIMEFLDLGEKSGIDGLKRALKFRLYSPLNKDRIEIDGNTLTYYTETCRVQAARERKGIPFHPCKSVGIVEYTVFAQTIDDRFSCECVSCYPDMTDTDNSCIWKFTLEE